MKKLLMAPFAVLLLAGLLIGAGETGTLNQSFARLYASNTSPSSITAPSATTTAPTGDGVFDLSASNVPPNQVALCFWGTRTSADNETFTARITGWRLCGDVWVPVPLLSLNCTQGAMTGVSGGTIGATQYFVDTITVGTAFTSAYEVISPGSDQVAVVKLDVFGCQKVQVQLAKGTNASCNAGIAGF